VALKPAFLTYLIGNLIYVLFYYVLFNFIDPGLEEVQKELTMDAMEKIGGLLGEDGMEAAIEQIENQDFSFGLGKALWTFAFSLIFPGFVSAAIIAAIMKDPKPVTG